MENTTTARIDIQRLQILNDRLCQTLDALNQVRMSAHSYASTASHAATTGYAPAQIGVGFSNPYLMGTLPAYQNPYQSFGYAPAFTGVYGQPQALPTQINNPWLAAYSPVVNPLVNSFNRQPISAFGAFGAVQPNVCY